MEQLEVNNVFFSYSNTLVFSNLSLSLNRGESLNIIGPSASGKTTLAKMLAGKEKYQGTIKINGVEIVKSNIYLLKRYVSVVFHEKYSSKNNVINELFNSMNDLNLEALEEQKIVKKVVEYFKIGNYLEKKLNSLSVYEKNYIKIIKKLVRQPHYLVLDDIFIDMKKEMVYKVVSYCKKNNISIINITSDLENTLYFDRMIVLYNKNIAMEGPTIECLKEEKILRRLGFNLPFMLDLSIQLGYYGLVDKVILDDKEMIKKIWNL